MLESGLIIKEVIDFCKDAKDYGVNVLNISRGNIITAVTLYEVAPVDIKNEFNVEDGERIRKETGMFTRLVFALVRTRRRTAAGLEDERREVCPSSFFISLYLTYWSPSLYPASRHTSTER